MDDNIFNISISFFYKEEPYKICFNTTSIYDKPNPKELNKKDLYARNEILVRGDIQLLLSSITNKMDLLFLRVLKVMYEGQIVFEASEYEVCHIPPMNK